MTSLEQTALTTKMWKMPKKQLRDMSRKGSAKKNTLNHEMEKASKSSQ